MKVNELIKRLEQYQDFDVDFVMWAESGDCRYSNPVIRCFEIIGIADIGHADKQIRLDYKERE